VTEVLLIRHGETDWNAARRLQGHLDIALNAAGQRQAAALGEALRDEPLDAIIASDLQRAAQTAQAVARPQGLRLRLDAGLRERCYGAFEGLHYSDIVHRYPEAYAAWQAGEADAVFPPGERVAESLRQFQQRAVTSILQYAQEYRGQKIALVAHGGVLECAYRAARSLPLDTRRDYPIPNASINRLMVVNGVLTLIAWGEVAHLQLAALDDLGAPVA
jgi:probable phosphoglycerate mutase